MKLRSLFYTGALISTIGLLALQANAADAGAKSVGDTWMAACTSAMSCRLTSDRLPPEDGGLAIPAFIRDAKAGSPFSMVLPSPEGYDLLSPDGTYTISVDDKVVAAVTVAELKRDTAEGGYVTADPSVVDPVLDAAKAGKTKITVAYDGPEVSEFAEADLSGFRQSLDWLDTHD
ncbi:hypothetical protein [Martelella endophytica]|uniref:Uncharacterized protein n=1 Tax=Martelella endophytica TaxID=1486262 RepID=A0A0D5LMK1_MAREN|nr:hypothetical protein [Martelella endophytica]AJY45361.1 hypothetical protein TM49_06085 [Martelella endophytica]